MKLTVISGKNPDDFAKERVRELPLGERMDLVLTGLSGSERSKKGVAYRPLISTWEKSGIADYGSGQETYMRILVHRCGDGDLPEQRIGFEGEEFQLDSGEYADQYHVIVTKRGDVAARKIHELKTDKPTIEEFYFAKVHTYLPHVEHSQFNLEWLLKRMDISLKSDDRFLVHDNIAWHSPEAKYIPEGVRKHKHCEDGCHDKIRLEIRLLVADHYDNIVKPVLEKLGYKQLVENPKAVGDNKK